MEIGVLAMIEIAPGAENAAGRKLFRSKKIHTPGPDMGLANVFCANTCPLIRENADVRSVHFDRRPYSCAYTSATRKKARKI